MTRMISLQLHFLLYAILLSASTRCLSASLLPLHLLSLAPTSGPVTGGTPVTISGSGFSTSSTLCQFGQAPSPSAVVVNSSILVCHSPVSTAVGFVPIRVSVDTGVTYTDHSIDFQYFGSIVLTSIAPTQGSSLGGQSRQKHISFPCSRFMLTLTHRLRRHNKWLHIFALISSCLCR
jgi:hypothetical protein